MKRLSLGLVAFSIPFLIALSVPSTRTLLRVQMLGSVSMAGSEDVVAPQVPWWGHFEDRNTFKASRLLASHPDDVRVQAMAAQEWRVQHFDADDSSPDTSLSAPNDYGDGYEVDNVKRGRRVCAEYDKIIAQHPREVWLIAKRLRLTTAWLRDNRLAGSLEDKQYPPHQPAHERDARHPATFNTRDLNTAIAAAKLGRQLEPDNSYFDWMLALFLMQGERDKDAFATLHQASLKARYNEHLEEEVRAANGVKELVRPRLLEEKIIDDASLRFFHLARFRHLARVARWQAVKWERAGKTAKALELRADVARASAPLMRGNSFLMTGWVGSAMQSIAWHRNVGKRITQDQLRAMGYDPQANGYNTFYARSFSQYAAAQGRPDLAEEALELNQQTTKFHRASGQAFQSGGGAHYGMTAPLLGRVRSLWWLGLALMAQMALLAASWFVVSLVLMRRRVPVEFQTAPPVPFRTVAARDLLLSVVPCAVATLLLIALAVKRGINADVWMQVVLPSTTEDYTSGLIFLAACVLAPVAIGALICGFTMSLRMRRALELSGERPSAEMGRERLGRERSSRYDGLTAWHGGGEIGSLLWTLATGCVAALSIGGLIVGAGALMVQPTGFSIPLPWPGASLAAANLAQAALTTGVLASALWLIGWIIKARWLTPLALRPLSLHGLGWFRATLAAFLIVSSWAYLGALSLSVAPRQQADAAFNTFLERGEIGMLSSQTSDHS